MMNDERSEYDIRKVPRGVWDHNLQGYGLR